MGATEPPQDFLKRLEELPARERIETLFSLGEPGEARITTQFIRTGCKLKSITVTSPSTAQAVFSFKVTPFYCNGSGNLHGGAQSTIFDICTSLVLMAIGREGWWINGGVSRTLTVNYLRPAPMDTEMELEAEVVAAGKSLALTRGVLKRASDGVPVSTCEHSKAAVPVKPQYKL